MKISNKSFRRINIGCGQRPTPGWDNYDNSTSVWMSRRPIISFILNRLGFLNEKQQENIVWNRKNPLVKWADAVKRIPAEDCSVHMIYTSHMVEHLDHDEVCRFLREVRRVLIPKGILRIAVPDLQKIVANYIASGDADQFLSAMNITSNKPKSLIRALQELMVGPRHHMWMYDGPSLCRLLASHGFVETEMVAPGETAMVSPGLLNLWEKSHESMYVEARAPE